MSTNIRSSSRNSEMEINRAASRGAGDTSARRKLSSREEHSKSQRPGSANSKAKSFQSATDVEVSETGASDSASSRSSSRISLGSRSRSNLSQTSLRSGMSTPTRHVSLTGVQRKQERDDLPIEPELDWREFTRSNSSLLFDGLPCTHSSQLPETDEDVLSGQSDGATAAYNREESQVFSDDLERPEVTEVTAKMEAAVITEGDNPQGEDVKKESSSEEDSDSDEEPRKAPNELLMEFLDCVMKKEFKTAEKLCRMILIYEPDNKEALTFHPVIMEKLQLEQEAAEAEKEGNVDDDDDEEDDDDEDDDDEDDDEEDDDDEDDSDEETSSGTDSSNDGDDDDNDNNPAEPDREGAMAPRPDSGIGL